MPRERPKAIQKKNNAGALTQKFHAANVEAKRARQAEAEQFAKSAPTFANPRPAKKREFVAAENSPENRTPLSEENLPPEEASYDAEPQPEERFDDAAPVAKISAEKVLAAIPAGIRNAVRDIFGAEFHVYRSNAKIFSPHDDKENKAAAGDNGNGGDNEISGDIEASPDTTQADVDEN